MYNSKIFTFSALFMILIATTLAVPFSSLSSTSSSRQGSVPTNSPIPTMNPSPSPFVEDEDESEASPDQSPEAEEVCVDAKYLSHVPNHQLVHKHHILSDVLCPIDSTLPCATSNHMIRVNDKRMSYGEFCEEHKCSKDKMEVNSVLSHLWNDEEHGDGVVLTMFDNRHPEMLQKSIHRIIATRRSLFKL